jgi:hypothetical protein
MKINKFWFIVGILILSIIIFCIFSTDGVISERQFWSETKNIYEMPFNERCVEKQFKNITYYDCLK